MPVTKTEQLKRQESIPFMSPEDVLSMLNRKATPVLSGGRRKEILLVNNLFSGGGGWDQELHETPEGFKRLNEEVLKGGALLLAESLDCDLNNEVSTKLYRREDNGRPYLIERKTYPTSQQGMHLILESWFMGDEGFTDKGKFYKQSLIIQRT